LQGLYLRSNSEGTSYWVLLWAWFKLDVTWDYLGLYLGPGSKGTLLENEHCFRFMSMNFTWEQFHWRVLRMILESPPVNFMWEQFPWSLGQKNLTRTSVFSFWFRESPMDFWCTFDALLHFWCAFDALSKTLLQAALHKLYLRCIQWTLLGTDCILFFNLIENSYFPNKVIYCKFLIHFWCTFQKRIKSASKMYSNCIKSASKAHQKCIKNIYIIILFGK
jgi:hypothetical protein